MLKRNFLIYYIKKYLKKDIKEKNLIKHLIFNI